MTIKPKPTKGIKMSTPQTSIQHSLQYMALSRLQSDCEDFLCSKGRNESDLWHGSVDAQIEEMKSRWNGLPDDAKPEWLSMEKINKYALEMGATF